MPRYSTKASDRINTRDAARQTTPRPDILCIHSGYDGAPRLSLEAGMDHQNHADAAGCENGSSFAGGEREKGHVQSDERLKDIAAPREGSS